MSDYTEEVLEAVKGNLEYIADVDINDVAEFLEAVSDSLYDGDVVAQVAAAMRDVGDGAA